MTFLNCASVRDKCHSSQIKCILHLVTIQIFAVVGDLLVHQFTFSFWPLLFKCLSDSATHFVIASLCWSYIENTSNSEKKYNLSRLFWCGLLASSIDLDHFLAAGSFNLLVLHIFPTSYCVKDFWKIPLKKISFSGGDISIKKTIFSLHYTLPHIGLCYTGNHGSLQKLWQTLEMDMVDIDIWNHTSLERWPQKRPLVLPIELHTAIPLLNISSWIDSLANFFKMELGSIKQAPNKTNCF